MHKGRANLKISYLGGGFDFPRSFEHHRVSILSEALDLQIHCVATESGLHWCCPPHLRRGLGASAAKAVAMLRAKYPDISLQEQVDTAIQLESLQRGGWQDPIAAAHHGFLKITLFEGKWKCEQLTGKWTTEIKKYRKLYEIPQEPAPETASILTDMKRRQSRLMQECVRQGTDALMRSDFPDFGRTLQKAWCIKKSWHPHISSPVIEKMADAAKDASAWGWKCCGAGGQGYLLVIGDEKCHEQLGEQWTRFQVDSQGTHHLKVGACAS